MNASADILLVLGRKILLCFAILFVQFGLASKISKDRTVASELSMLKACDDLLQKKIRVDPKQFPSLAPCENYRVMMNNIAKAEELPDQKKPPSQPIIKPVTDRAL